MTSIDQDRIVYQAPVNRLAWRDTHIYASDSRDTVLGGLWAAEGITHTCLYSMVGILCIFTDTFVLQDDSQRLVERDEQPLQPGNYYIITNGSITITNKVPLLRTLSLYTGTRVQPFFHSVRLRDRRCVITGRPAVINGVYYWDGFEITVLPASGSHGTINSVQNGMLLTRDMHALFASYQFSINPDVCGIAGAHLDQLFLNHPHRPVDELFRWHFRQAVLANMKGIGEPCFETDFPPGSDIMGQIMSGPKAGERMEFELFGRFNAQGICA
ncbi:hypothetical protein B9Z19DRAFT_1113409 [Tuber borchii]|uniref:Uncharacterized protein n=1 Tax=Tuber borchii TaxID=42251 RepID=A0A2T7A167_TUBBO|nr:hypothetical protein B9Z19DRAFT_1113409 [Tuber borchii]